MPDISLHRQCTLWNPVTPAAPRPGTSGPAGRMAWWTVSARNLDPFVTVDDQINHFGGFCNMFFRAEGLSHSFIPY